MLYQEELKVNFRTHLESVPKQTNRFDPVNTLDIRIVAFGMQSKERSAKSSLRLAPASVFDPFAVTLSVLLQKSRKSVTRPFKLNS